MLGERCPLLGSLPRVGGVRGLLLGNWRRRRGGVSLRSRRPLYREGGRDRDRDRDRDREDDLDDPVYDEEE